MSTLRTRITAPIVIALALTLTPALAGCSVIEGVISNATGGDVDLGGTSIPDGYPTAEVPVIDGQILFGASVSNADGTVYNVTVKVSDENALETIKSQLEAAGFVSETGASSGTYIAKTDKWGVLVVVSKDGQNGFVANYTVTSADAAQ